ncbi:MAG: NADH:ubiquinone reductase (Na(+)-transporting) subunit F [Gammaproteobacteria bacterium]|nr:NADH:ubiquinone reductase (Na(+)-transporting) subunit F [Gammaproteobacteria bacterium]MDH3536992.1 NADH:ubiquinone reductase (Na(+)-transporting) subunit F [Gammaproteobacteria bacterium]
MLEALLGIVFFSAIVLLLTLFVLGARRVLVPSGECEIQINGRKTVEAQVGQRLLEVCQQAGIHLPSACAGAGTCGLCKVRVVDGGGEAGAQELAHLNRREAGRGGRLACQVPVLGPMSIEVDEAYFDIRSWHCQVERTRNVSTLIREIVLRLPEGEPMEFRAGGFVELTSPPYQLEFGALDIEPEFRDVWDRMNLWRLKAGSDVEVTRAYSMANHPAEKGIIILNIRIALPPPDNASAPPGVVSSWLFALKPGDPVTLRGPYGHFAVEPSDRELVFIGGGAGMAPLRAQILDLLETQHSARRITYWYGARSRRELYYEDVFEALQREHENFAWHPALSEPEKSDAWEGYTGFIHQVALDNYLAKHAAPERCEYYFCGPPLMVQSVLAMLDELGVDAENIHFDDFGS